MFLKKLSFIAGLLLLIVLVNSVASSQSISDYRLFSENTDNTIPGNSEITKNLAKAEILNIDRGILTELYNSRLPEISISLPYGDRRDVRLNLRRSDILSPDAKIVARTVNGDEEVKLNDILVAYTGSIEGERNTTASFTFTKEDVKGLIISGDDNYNLGLINDNSGNSTDKYVFYKESDLKSKNSFFCGTEDNLSSEYISEMRRIITEKMNDASPTDLYIAEIAIEIDFATYNIYNQSVSAATNYALTLMSAASAIYMKEVNVKLIVPYLRVWTTTDPYNGTNSSSILSQFRSQWNSTQQGVQRTLAHFITRRSGNMGGIAFLDALCSGGSSGYGYGFSNTNGPILPLPTYSWDVMVVCHEIGHNFGSNHTHNCGWVGGPIDSCYTVEGGCYSGPMIPRVGTIMSYCHLNGSISLTQGFGPQPKTIIRSNAQSAPCMYVSSDPLQIGYPNGGESFRTGEMRQIYWGTSLTGNVNIELSVNNGATWQIIQNNVPAVQRVFDWAVPYMASTSQAKIRILNSSAQSTGDTSDGAFTIVLNLNAFNPLTPASFSRVNVSSGSSELFDFKWSSAGTDPSIKYKLKIRKVGTSVDYIYSSNNTGSDTVISMRKSYLDSLAAVFGTTGDSVRCTWKPWGYNGVDSLSSSSTFVLTLVRNTVGINVLSSLVPEKFLLGNNYPNPFNPSTSIKFDIPVPGITVLKIYDSGGREVETLLNSKLQPGSYEFSFNAVNLPSGVYFYRLTSNEFSQTKKMVLLK